MIKEELHPGLQTLISLTGVTPVDQLLNRIVQFEPDENKVKRLNRLRRNLYATNLVEDQVPPSAEVLPAQLTEIESFFSDYEITPASVRSFLNAMMGVPQTLSTILTHFSPEPLREAKPSEAVE
jgi:hypothetical protein